MPVWICHIYYVYLRHIFSFALESKLYHELEISKTHLYSLKNRRSSALYQNSKRQKRPKTEILSHFIKKYKNLFIFSQTETLAHFIKNLIFFYLLSKQKF